MSGWRIRSAQPGDAPEIARLAGVLGYPTDAAAMRARLASLAAQPGQWVAVAAAPEPQPQARAAGADPLCGWIHVARRMTLETGEYAEILGLVVDGASRRGGVGRRLVAQAESWAFEQGLSRISVRSNTARAQSHPFYVALGYQRPKTQHVYLKALVAPGG
jgi:GNAT superfamily N-acetyltransferase